MHVWLDSRLKDFGNDGTKQSQKHQTGGVNSLFSMSDCAADAAFAFCCLSLEKGNPVKHSPVGAPNQNENKVSLRRVFGFPITDSGLPNGRLIEIDSGGACLVGIAVFARDPLVEMMGWRVHCWGEDAAVKAV